MLNYKNKSSVKLLSGDGTKVHGGALIKSMSISQGPSLIEKIRKGWKINFISGVDCTGMYIYIKFIFLTFLMLNSNLETDNLEDRKNLIINTSKHIADKVGFLFSEGKM